MVNKLLRVPGPWSYRLMVVELRGEVMLGQTSGHLSLRGDIADYQRDDCKPLYAIFVRPKLTPPPCGLAPASSEGDRE